MTATYNPAEVERLIVEAREDDARIPAGPWSAGRDGAVLAPNPNSWHGGTMSPARDNMGDPRVTAGIARTRNNLRAMADQLEAARDIIAGLSPQDIQAVIDDNDRLRKAFDELIGKLKGKASVHSGFCCWCGQHWPHLDGESYETFRKYTVEHAETCPAHNIRIERDAARAEIDRVRRVERLAFDAARDQRNAELEVARARIAELEGALTAACDLGEPLRGTDDPRLREPHRVELLPVFTTGTTREQRAATWDDLRKTARPR